MPRIPYNRDYIYISRHFLLLKGFFLVNIPYITVCSSATKRRISLSVLYQFYSSQDGRGIYPFIYYMYVYYIYLIEFIVPLLKGISITDTLALMHRAISPYLLKYMHIIVDAFLYLIVHTFVDFSLSRLTSRLYLCADIYISS